MALPIIIDGITFSDGGEGDYYQLDLLNDSEGFQDLGRTLYIENLGSVGVGDDIIYFQLGDENGKWCNAKSLEEDTAFQFVFDDGIDFKTIRVWASNAGVTFNAVITKGRK